MSRNTGSRLDRVGGIVTVYHEGPAGTLPTLADFTELSRSSSKLRSDNIHIVYDDGAGVRRVYYVTSRGNLCYVDLSGSGSLGGTAYVYLVVPETTLTTGSNKVGRIYVDFSGTITEVHASVITAPTGSTIICDVNLNGVSIWFTTPANRVTIATGEYTHTQTAFDTTAVAEGDYLTVDVDQIGSTVAGAKLVVRVNIER